MPKPTLDELRDAYGPGIEELIHIERIHGRVSRAKLADLFDELFALPVH